MKPKPSSSRPKPVKRYRVEDMKQEGGGVLIVKPNGKPWAFFDESTGRFICRELNRLLTKIGKKTP